MKLAFLLVLLPSFAFAQFVAPSFGAADATHAGAVTTGTQTFAGDKTFTGAMQFDNSANFSADVDVLGDLGGTTATFSQLVTFGDDIHVTGNVITSGLAASASISASNLSGNNTGDITLATVGSTPANAGASLSGQVLTLQPADATHGGVVSTTTQTFAGDKTFTGGLTLSGTSGLSITGVTGTNVAIAIPAGTRLSLNGSTATALLFNNGSSIGVSSLVATAGIVAGDESRADGWFKQTAKTLDTCGSAASGRIEQDATGGTGGKKVKYCFCSWNGSAGAWVSMGGGGTGTSTTCPDTP